MNNQSLTTESSKEETGVTYKSKTYRKPTGCGNIYITVTFRDEAPEKIEFIRIIGSGSNNCGGSFYESLSDMLTFSIRRIRNQYEADSIVKNLRHHRCNKIIPNRNHITSCSDAVGQVLHQVLKNGQKKEGKE